MVFSLRSERLRGGVRRVNFKYRARIPFAGGALLKISEVQRQEADIKDQRTTEECRKEVAEWKKGKGGTHSVRWGSRNGFAELAFYFEEEAEEGWWADCWVSCRVVCLPPT
jgi:hypothetical protein